MKEEKYTEIEKEIFDYLKEKQCFCFRRGILGNLVKNGLKKTNIILVMREMRKDKKLVFGYRRWGIRYL